MGANQQLDFGSRICGCYTYCIYGPHQGYFEVEWNESHVRGDDQ
jgi:hypothetical protein